MVLFPAVFPDSQTESVPVSILFPIFLEEKKKSLNMWGSRGSMFEAMARGDLESLEMLLKTEDEVCTVNGRSALYWAVSGGHAEVARVLLQSGRFDIEEVVGGMTLLLIAACRGHVEVVRVLIDGGAAFEHESEEGVRALRQASFLGNAGVVQLLCERGADIFAPGPNNGMTAALYAASNGKLDCLTILSRFGALMSVEARWHAFAVARSHPDVQWFLRHDLPVRISNCRLAVMCLLGLKHARAKETRFLTFIPKQLINQMARWLWATRYQDDWSFFVLEIEME